jgi:hypothetical protein
MLDDFNKATPALSTPERPGSVTKVDCQGPLPTELRLWPSVPLPTVSWIDRNSASVSRAYPLKMGNGCYVPT